MVMQQANNPPDIQVLDRYLSGSTTERESEIVENWLSQSAENRTILEALTAAVTSPIGRIPVYDRNATVARVVEYSVNNRGFDTPSSSEISEPRHSKVLSIFPFSLFRDPQRISRAIMPLTFAVIMLSTGWWLRDSKIGSDISDGNVSIYTTGNGERATVTLLDGSTVVLNVASRLEVPANYGVSSRALRLSGEALFTVKHKSNSPFTVVAGDNTTKVLGTSFAVRHYPEDTLTIVAVQDGRVSVKSSVINANQQVKVSKHGQPVLSEAREGSFTFASSILTLEGQEFINAIAELERWYDVRIKFGDTELESRWIGGQFIAGSLSDLREILEVTFGVRVERNGRTLTLYSR